MKLVNIIKNTNKIQNVDDIIDNFEIILELTKDDVKRISRSKNIYFADFDFIFIEATKILKKQIKKTNLKAIQKFYKCQNLSKAITFLISRILNNMRNITTNKKYKEFIEINIDKNIDENSIIYNNDEIENIINEDYLRKIDEKKIKKGLKKVWYESKYDKDFDKNDFEELCKKFKKGVTDVITIDEFNQPKFISEQAESCNFQLVLCFN